MSDDIIARVHTLHKPYFDNCINACCSGEQCKNRSQLCMECGELWPCAATELVAELKTTRQFRYQVADALGFVECVEGVGNAIIADDVTILDYVRAQAETARKHETECPVWCDDHEHFEHALSCKECGGSGCGPGTATGAHEGCDECGGDGRDHDFAYVHAPDVEAELKTTRAQRDEFAAQLDDALREAEGV